MSAEHYPAGLGTAGLFAAAEEDRALAVEFGTTIRGLRERHGWLQKDLAARLSLSPQYLNDLELGRRGPPPDRLIAALAGALDTDLSTLLLQAGRVRGALREALLHDPALLQRLDRTAQAKP